MVELVRYDSPDEVLRLGVHPADHPYSFYDDYEYNWANLYVFDNVLCLYLGQSEINNEWLVPNIFKQFHTLDPYYSVEIYMMEAIQENQRELNNITQYLRLWSRLPTKLFVPRTSKFATSDGTWIIDGETQIVGNLGERIRGKIDTQQLIADNPPKGNGYRDYTPRETKACASQARLYVEALTLALGRPRAKRC